ncbi:MAG TPA: hypothetical protein VHD56_12695 [Tepidisphaeraceae bacterium]|nr:hypothetical protein [Tepidisphaeraceae bacterium]
MSDAPPILVLCRDLLFSSKITATAQSLGVPVKVLRDPIKLEEKMTSRRLLVDLNQDGFLDAAAHWRTKTGGHVTGFVGHTDASTIAKAQTLEIDSILTRGGFVANLNDILT